MWIILLLILVGGAAVFFLKKKKNSESAPTPQPTPNAVSDTDVVDEYQGYTNPSSGSKDFP